MRPCEGGLARGGPAVDARDDRLRAASRRNRLRQPRRHRGPFAQLHRQQGAHQLHTRARNCDHRVNLVAAYLPRVRTAVLPRFARGARRGLGAARPSLSTQWVSRREGQASPHPVRPENGGGRVPDHRRSADADGFGVGRLGGRTSRIRSTSPKTCRSKPETASTPSSSKRDATRSSDVSATADTRGDSPAELRHSPAGVQGKRPVRGLPGSEDVDR